MPKRLEEFMRQGMQRVGHAVEKVIGKAQAAKATVVTSSGLTPVAGLEAQLGLPKLRELLLQATDRLISPLIPSLGGGTVLEVADGAGKFALALKEHGAKVVAALEAGNGTPSIVTDATRQLYVIRANLRRLPFADGVFEYALANFATPVQGDFSRAVKELGRVVAPGGQVVITDFHPFGSYAKRGSTRLKPVESTFRGVADYFKVARLAGLSVLDIREAFIDETLRVAFTTPEEKTAYRMLKDSPLMVCVIARKDRPKGPKGTSDGV